MTIEINLEESIFAVDGVNLVSEGQAGGEGGVGYMKVDIKNLLDLPGDSLKALAVAAGMMQGIADFLKEHSGLSTFAVSPGGKAGLPDGWDFLKGDDDDS